MTTEAKQIANKIDKKIDTGADIMKKESIKFFRMFIGILKLSLVILVIYGIYLFSIFTVLYVNMFEYTKQPIIPKDNDKSVILKIQWPLRIEKRPVISKITIKTIDTSLEDKKMAKINDLYRKVRFVESTSGMNDGDQTATHNYCQSIGQVNELGYLVDGNRQFCFKDYNEQFTTFKNWWMKRLDDKMSNVDSLLCVWNTGTAQPMCTYSIKINNLN